MAPALLGPHFLVRCGNCGGSWFADWRSTGRVTSSRCPVCGELHLAAASGQLPGDRVVLQPIRDPTAPLAVARWDIVAVTPRADANSDGKVNPSGATPRSIFVKRVVGLPGEQIQIRDGQVWINERPAAKSLGQMLQRNLQVVPLHIDGAVPDWHADWSADDAWRREADRFVYVPSDRSKTAAAAKPSVAWLRFTHQDPYASGTGRPIVLDDYPYNLGLSRKLHEVAELAVQFEFFGGREPLVCRVDRWTFWWDRYRGSIELHRDGVRIVERRDAPTASTAHQQVRFGYLDGSLHWQMGTDGRTQWAWWVPLAPEDWFWKKTPQIAIGIANMPVPPGDTKPSRRTVTGEVTAAHVGRLRVFRDTYDTIDRAVTRPRPADSSVTMATSQTVEMPLRLGAGQYFLLGDNVPRSRDSRHPSFGLAGPGGRLEMVGRVLGVVKKRVSSEP